LVSDEDDDDDTDIDFGNFSTCSPRFSRIISTHDPATTSHLKDLQEQASKEASSADDRSDDHSEAEGTNLDSVKDDTISDETPASALKEDSSPTVPVDQLRKKLEPVLLSSDVATDSGNDSGTPVSGNSSLNNSMNNTDGLSPPVGNSVSGRGRSLTTSSLLKQIHVDVYKKQEDSALSESE